MFDMDISNLYDMIYKRKSIRKFDMKPLEGDKLDEIRSFIEDLQPLHKSIKLSFKIIGQESAKGGLFSIKAPHYLAVYSEIKEDYLMNAGFMLQQVDLFMSNIGLGACWLGLTKPGREIIPEDNMEFIIVLAFGQPAEPLYRKDLAEFRRKPLGEIASLGDFGENSMVLSILEAARLAPSASNSQTWYFTGSPDAIRVSRLKLNPLKGMIYNRMNQIDNGICLCHLLLAAGKIGKKTVFFKENLDITSQLKGYDYMMTVGLLDEK